MHLNDYAISPQKKVNKIKTNKVNANNISDKNKELSDTESLILVNQAYTIAKLLLEEYRDSFDRIVSLLIQKRILNTEEVETCIDRENSTVHANLWD